VSAADVRGKVQLTWIANPAFKQVRIYRRRTDRDEPFAPVGQTAENVFVDTRVELGGAYRYRLAGIGQDGAEGRLSSEVAVRVSALIRKPPTVPALEGYLLLEDGAVGLKWSAREGEDVIAYNVYRRSLPGGEYGLVGSTQSTNFRDGPLPLGRSFEYALTALDTALRETPFSPGLAVTIAAKVPVVEEKVEETWRVRRTRLVALVTVADVALLRPSDLAIGPLSGAVYLADSGRGRVYVYSAAGVYLRSLGPGRGGEERFENLLGLGVDAEENLYAVDAGRGVVQVTEAGGVLKRLVNVPPPQPGAATGLIDVAVRPGGLLAIVDNLNNRVAFDGPGGEGRWLGQAGAEPGDFSAPTFCATDGQGNLYVADALNARVQVFAPSGAFLRSFGRYARGPGGLGRPKGVAVAGSGEVYVADSWLNTVQVFDPAGRFVAVLGDENGEPLDLGSPNGVALGRGNLLAIAERLSARLQIREIVGAP
ncbi:MAG TPA: hypothetical protein VN317_00260, partial [Candidatus Methanoperedens sp.]|nr:hypothetical protein [Candidatus Methanoperedens sp.]